MWGEAHSFLTQANNAKKADFICLGCEANVTINDGEPSINDMQQKINDAVKMAFAGVKRPRETDPPRRRKSE